MLFALCLGCKGSPTPSEIARRLDVKLTPEQRECIAEHGAHAALVASVCGKNNEGTCNNDAIYAQALERKYGCLHR